MHVADAVQSLRPDAEPYSGRLFVDPDRGVEWIASVGLDVEGRFCPVFARGGIRLWGSEEITVDIDLVSEDLLRKCWRGSRRGVWDGRERWWVRWEERPSEEAWTWLESDSGMKLVIKAQYPFPYVDESEFTGVMETAEAVDESAAPVG